MTTQRHEAATSPTERCIEALRLILPLAKGYAAAHPVGSNSIYVSEAEQALENLSAPLPPASEVEGIIAGIFDELNDRKGLHLDGLDDEIQDEIRAAFRKIISGCRPSPRRQAECAG